MVRSLSHRRAIIVGAGHSGLAVASALTSHGLEAQKDFVIIDSAPPGQRSWASHWHSMRLRSDARNSSLPGFPFPGDGLRHPGAHEMSDYLASVENALGAKPLWGVRALGVDRRGDGSTLYLSTSIGEVQTRNIVCATGAAAMPRVPTWRQNLSVSGTVLHSGQYLHPAQIPSGNVLVVGGGFSGVQIAEELAHSREVTLSARTERPHPSVRWPIWRRLRRSHSDRANPAPADVAGVSHAPPVAEADGATVTFADGSTMQPHSVILATGYEPGDLWLPGPEPSVGPTRATTHTPGLFTVGIPRYSRAGADTIPGAWRDASVVARNIIDRP